MPDDPASRLTELDRTRYPAWLDAIVAAEDSGDADARPPRRYPGYPVVPLPRHRPRLWPPLDRILARRRSPHRLGDALPTRSALGRILGSAHGVTGPDARGPVPSAGGLQALELYLASWAPGWLPPGSYHYDRRAHALTRLAEGCARDDLAGCAPSLQRLGGGALAWIIVGDGARVAVKYGPRGLRFLLLEAGHLMQNLGLASAGVGLATVPLGGYFEADLARRLGLLPADEVLYLGVCGAQNK